jgi:hypothetical protein
MSSNPQPIKRRIRYGKWGLGLALLGLFFIPAIAVFAATDRASLLPRVGLLCQVVAYYALIVGFVASTRAWGFVKGMTSPNPFHFAASNMAFVSLLFGFAATTLSPTRIQTERLCLGLIGFLLSLALLPLLFIYALAHIFFTAPPSFFGYFIASSLLESVITAGEDVEFTQSAVDGAQVNRVTIRDLASKNPEVAKSFMVGVPAVVATIVSEVIEVFGG